MKIVQTEIPKIFIDPVLCQNRADNPRPQISDTKHEAEKQNPMQRVHIIAVWSFSPTLYIIPK